MTTPRIRHDKEAYWGLKQEVEYLDELGTGKWSNVTMSRENLLRSYLATVIHRTEPWVKKAYEAAANMLIREMNFSKPVKRTHWWEGEE